jgi:hypothetical protein
MWKAARMPLAHQKSQEGVDNSHAGTAKDGETSTEKPGFSNIRAGAAFFGDS